MQFVIVVFLIILTCLLAGFVIVLCAISSFAIISLRRIQLMAFTFIISLLSLVSKVSACLL